LADTLVIIPTYNEKENITAIINAVLDLGDDFNVLVVDDGSPDGTADLVDSMILSNPERIFILKRKGKAGIYKQVVLKSLT
jgi:dolichol-phosphate mannosyltransferase